MGMFNLIAMLAIPVNFVLAKTSKTATYYAHKTLPKAFCPVHQSCKVTDERKRNKFHQNVLKMRTKETNMP